jgi:4-hydroxy-tetrahydrodipicolinate synthase
LSFSALTGTIFGLLFQAIFIMFTGSMVALVTPMHVDGCVDYPALERLVEFHIENQTDAIVSVGTSGESATLTHKENLEVIKQTVAFSAGRVPIIAGTGSNSTAEAIEMTALAHKAGADAALLVVPYYNKPEQAGLFLHFQAIAQAVPMPQIMYNVPGRTARNMDNDTSIKLAAISNIVGIKDATGDMPAGKDLIERSPDNFDVWSGDDSTTLELIKLGGKGCISVTANVAPRTMHRMCQAALEGDFASADELNAKLDPLHKNLFIEANPIPVKYAVSRMGLMGPTIRLPLTELATDHRGKVEQAIAHANIKLP